MIFALARNHKATLAAAAAAAETRQTKQSLREKKKADLQVAAGLLVW